KGRICEYAAVHALHEKGYPVAGQVALLQEKSITQRQQIVGLEPKRADVIFAGAYLFEKIMESVGASEVGVRDHGVRYGLLHEAAKTL
ncbi:MAG: hypothetical protein ACXW6R_12015, partial [Candidatus Binatia bacterium]